MMKKGQKGLKWPKNPPYPIGESLKTPKNGLFGLPEIRIYDTLR
jgi:hypothetical protein